MSRILPVSSDYYTKRQKVIRDLVHGYIHLTAFEITLVDTAYFQRLRGIKQMTASFVFPNANHTRFEHSLGTFELTRRAIEAVKSNGLFLYDDCNSNNTINPNVEFSTLIAALLHDIGHCPFSHLGEKQFNKRVLSSALEKSLKNAGINDNTAKYLSDNGANHEKLSCILIIDKMWSAADINLSNDKMYTLNNTNIALNLEHMCRCILGVRYKTESELPDNFDKTPEGLLTANFCISLVNGKSFDMDSLDYIMRDNLYCGLSEGRIDTDRLFSNMSISRNGLPIFKRQAISVLKDIIDQKNNDYLYIVNHHGVLYSNFMYEYVFRRLKLDNQYNADEFFSINAVCNKLVTDCDVMVALRKKDAEYCNIITNGYYDSENNEKVVNRAHALLTSLFTRNFLKPLWKDIMEFEEFKNRHFNDMDQTFNRICGYVCNSEYSEEFRSEVVSTVTKIANESFKSSSISIPIKLNSYELILVEARQKWLDQVNVRDLSIYVRENEVRNPNRFGGTTRYAYIEKQIGEVLPLSPYSEHYSTNSFYVYIKPIETTNQDMERRYYDTIEKIIVLVLSYYADHYDKFLSVVYNSNKADKEKVKNEICDEIAKIVNFDIN